MTLTDWLRNHWLTAHETTPAEIENLFALADRDLKDAQTAGLSADGRLRLAYNAALQAATAALAAAGYRTGRGESHHFRVIQSLVHTIGASSSIVDEFDAFRKRRNVADYERAGTVSDHDADEMVALARQLREEVVACLRANHPGLIV